MEKQDGLTGLFNRWGFYFEVQQVLKKSDEKNYQIVCFDVRHFKLINDLFGFSGGDTLLQKVARFLKENGHPTGIYARLEADKFGAFISEQYAQQIINLFLETKFFVDEERSYMTHIDVGVYEIDDKTIPVSLMCDRAFMAMGTIKEDSGKHVAYFKQTMREKMLKEQILYGDLHRAINNKEMVIYLQGLYDNSEKIVGAEVLTRWNHPARGILPAGEFMEALERNGLIVSLDVCVWEMACVLLQKWKQAGKDHLFLSVNISAKDFESIDVCDVLTNLVQKYQVPTENLRLELTETALMEDIESNLKIINRLRANGFTVEIDDFGSGYSSLNMLKDIKADVVKLDMKFLQKCEDEERSKMILQAMIELMKKLEMQVIVEGVETREHLNLLKEYKCDIYQGYYFMRPIDVESFEKEVDSNKYF